MREEGERRENAIKEPLRENTEIEKCVERSGFTSGVLTGMPR